MDAMNPTSMWEIGTDGRGVNCWRNKVTRQVRYTDPEWVGLAVGQSPNSHQFVQFTPTSGSTDSPWDEYKDPRSNNKYWYNRVTKETTWQDPKPAEEKEQQPPPPKPEKPEHEQWSRIDDPKKGKGWYNEKTEKFQSERPMCLKKYR